MMTDYTDISKIPEWAKQMACDKVQKLTNYRGHNKLAPRLVGVPGFESLTALALMCWQYCEEPVDPDLLIARKAVAQVCERIKLDDDAARFRNGKMDRSLKDSPTIIAARLVREQGAK